MKLSSMFFVFVFKGNKSPIYENAAKVDIFVDKKA